MIIAVPLVVPVDACMASFSPLFSRNVILLRRQACFPLTFSDFRPINFHGFIPGGFCSSFLNRQGRFVIWFYFSFTAKKCKNTEPDTQCINVLFTRNIETSK